jgi:hypothetical protein
MTWSVRNRLALIAALVLFGAAAGCGDNTPKAGGQGGESGTDGGGGASGMDGGPDADANGDALDANDAGDANSDSKTDAVDGKDGAAGSDAGDAGDAKDGAAGSDAGDAKDGAAGNDAGDATGAAGSDGGLAGADGAAGSDAGDAGDASMDVPPETPATPACYTVTFTKPVDNAQLSAADDKDGDQCADGFQYDVVISTGAPDGTVTQLFGGASMLAMATAAGGTVTFANVQLTANGVTNLSIQFPSTMPCVDPSTKAKVTVDCSVPTCSVSKPTISATHPALNGVPAAQGGDRASAAGSPYQVAFEVTTNIADNQNVFLDVDNAAAPTVITTVSAKAMSGKAVFAGVPLPGDGTYDVQGRCVDGNGVVGRSAKGSYPVDTTPPDLTVSKPASGAFIGPGGLTAGAFPVCGSTTATDAVNLPGSLGAGQQNYCVSTSGTPICKPAGAVGVDTCVNVPCPGDAPFSITVTLSDGAGNPTTTVLTGITCSATTPTVQIVTPVTDAPTFTDPSRHLLAATAAQAFKDQNAGTPGAQTDVVACASRGGTAALFAGHTGDATLTQVGASVATTAATAADGCPAGLGFVARFTGVTLPESVETATGALATATQLRVDVTDVSASTGSSAPLDLWVDSTPPAISLTSPANLCGSFQQAFATFNTDLTYTTDTSNVTATITNNGTTATLSSPTFAAGMATFSGVMFNVGLNSLSALAKDAAGNVTATPLPCDITVGMAPVVIFTSPTASNVLCPTTGSQANCINDTDAATPGWQGPLTVQALVGGVPLTTGNITFSVGGTTLGSAPLDNTGHATLPSVTFLDGDVTITATTDNVAGHGVGTGTVTVTVDLGPPGAPTGLAAAVLNRRQTSFQLSWTAPADAGGGKVASYDVRVATVPITPANFDDASVTTAVPFTGTPAAPGALDGISVTNKYIEIGYYFAVRARDAAGNVSAIVTTDALGATAAHFKVTPINSMLGSNERFGFAVSGDGDLNGDGLSDILVSTSGVGRAYLFFGSATFASTAPAVTFTGASTGFGFRAMQIGDIDNDGHPDVAISDPLNGLKVYIYKGRTTWPMTLTDAQADYVISTDASYAGSLFGFSLARLGDFDGDNIDDLAIGARSFGGGVGRAVIIRGSASFASVALPDTTHAITIDGNAAFGSSAFGYKVMGLGHYYSVTTGTTLVVSAPSGALSVPAAVGHVYTFHGQSGTGGAIALSSADNVLAGLNASAKIGVTLTNLGPIFNGFPSIGIGNTLDTTGVAGASGTAYLTSGTPSTSPFTTVQVAYLTGATATGAALIGGGISGRDVSLSLIGDSTPDLVLSGQTGGTLVIADGAKLAAKGSPVNLATKAEISIALPAGWGTGEAATSIITDIDGDGAADFCLGSLTNPGAILVFW